MAPFDVKIGSFEAGDNFRPFPPDFWGPGALRGPFWGPWGPMGPLGAAVAARWRCPMAPMSAL